MNLAVALTSLADSEVADADVTPGVLGFILIFAIGVGLFFLLRSMRQKLLRIQKDEANTFGTKQEEQG